MTTFHIIVVTGVALGIVQLAAGVGIGLWIGRRRTVKALEANDHERAARLAADLAGLTAMIASSVRRHNAAITSIDQRLRSECEQDQSDAPLTNLVVGVVSEMLAANQRLSGELSTAEAELERQSGELLEHRRQSLTDPLTDLPNRRALDDHLRSQLEAWRKHQASFSVLMLDIDHFKQFNDTHGHQAGDAALVAFGDAVRRALRKQDVVARYGGEEFAVLLPQTTLLESRAAVEKIRKSLSETRVEIGEQRLPLAASGGLACIAPVESATSLLGRADEALYAAKENGRDRVYYHDGQGVFPLAEFREEPELAEDVRQACDDLRAGLVDFLGDGSGGDAPACEEADSAGLSS